MQLIFDFPVSARYSLENFVVCEGNKTAYRFAERLASGDGTENLLYVYGPPGSGKTHLLNAVSNSINAHYFSFKEISATPDPDAPTLPELYADSEALVLDDLHLIPNSQDARVELWELFNTFYSAGKRIALAGLTPPKELPNLDGHLTSRLLWGLVAGMDVSTDQSRRMILKKLAKDRQMILADEVIEEILLRVRRDIPSLIYALESINRLAISTKRKISPRLAKEALGLI